MASKMVVARQKSAAAVGAAGEQHRAEIYVGWDKRFGSLLAQAVGTLLTSAFVTLESLTTKLVDADEENLREISEDGDARREHTAATANLREQYILTRNELAVAFGEAAPVACGYESADRDPVVLERQARRFAGKLSTFNPGIPPRIKNYTFDRNELADRVLVACDRLDAASKHLKIERKQTDETLVVKNQAMKEFDEFFRFAANFTSSALEVVGHTELARKVRPSSRRPGMTTEVEETTPPEDLEAEVSEDAA